MEKVLCIPREFLTVGFRYKIRCIKTKKSGVFSISRDYYEVIDDTGEKQDVPAMMFRDLNQQELRANALKELGI